MAMLAEPRRKTKYRLQPYTSLSKSNKRCDGDTNSIGFKLMSSMGWMPGKGLGADESGEVDPIKLRLKNDSAGVGFKLSEQDAVSQQSEFQALLQQLNSGNVSNELQEEPCKPNVISLEKKSEKSLVRVHYKKFTRGKDLSRASEKDLRSILGITSSGSIVKPAEQQVELLPPSEDTSEGTGSQMYITAGSSTDYFMEKFKDFKNRRKSTKSLLNDANTSEIDQGELSDNGSNSIKRRSVTWGGVDVSYVENYIKDMADTSGSADETFNNDLCSEKMPNKKKKKKRIAESTEICVDSRNQNELGLSVNKKKKKKQKKNYCEVGHEEEIDGTQDVDHGVPKKKKKKLKLCGSIEDSIEATDNGSDHNMEAVIVEEKDSTNLESTIKSKKKKKKERNAGLIEE